ncbi:DegV family protein with EDD domain [Bacilli bacterium PM5-9]|nr:DegV family protein with EDD domain [Bacilli bacterium PM5-9]
MKIAYLVDSSISLASNDKILDNEDCFFLPLHIIIDKIDYLDDGNIDRNTLIDKVKNAKNVTTSQPAYGEVEYVIENIIKAGYDVIVCSLIGSGISGTQNVVYSCAIDKKITVVNLDSRGVGPMQIYAIKMFKDEVAKGASLLEVQAKVQHMLDVSNCYAIVDDLSYLKRGGRISGSSAVVGSLLKIKPIVMCSKKQNGKVVNIDKVRTRKKAYDQLEKIAFENIDVDEYMIVIGSYDADEYAKALKEVIISKYPDIVVDIMDLCFAIGAHTGPNTVALFTVRK